MPQFRVGDRIKYTDNGWSAFLRLNEEYTVAEVNPRGNVLVMDGLGRKGPYNPDRFELVTPRPGTVFYSVVYRSDPAAILQVIGFETERSFNDWMRVAPRYGYEIICKKKLTLTLPNQEA